MKRASIGLLSIITIIGCMVWGNSLSHAATSFVHPGLLNNRAQYDLMKTKVVAKAEPWYSAYRQIPDYRSYTPKPVADFYVTYSDTVDENTLDKDGIAAYASALHWIITGNTQHAEKAKQIVNAWAYTLRTVGGNSQQRLAMSWHWFRMMLTAEILKHAYGNWSAADQQKFETVVRTLVLPNLQWTDIDGSGGNTPRNNWAAFGAMERMAIGIYLNDQSLFNQAVSDYKQLVNFYIGTFNQNVPTGFTFETCRQGNGDMGTLNGGDLAHTQMGLGALIQTAEMAKKQGVNLYDYRDSSDSASLLTAMVYHAPFIGYPHRGSATTWPCETDLGSLWTDPAMPWHMAYNHYQHQALKAVATYDGNSGNTATGASYDNLTHVYGNSGSLPEPGTPISSPTNVRVASGN
jgi:hypothetical protein